jgi:hypothetical protein
MAEDQVDDTPDVSLIDTDWKAPLNEEPSETPVENAEHEGTDTQEEPTEKPTEEESEGEQEPVKQPETDEDAAAQKARNEAYARQRIQERERTRQSVEKQIEEAYGPKSEQELVDEGLTERDAQVEALRQEMQFERQKTQIAQLNAGLQAEAVNVTNDFPVFNPNSKDYDPEFAGIVEQQYKQAARLQLDDNGIVVNADVPLYDYYQQMATIYNRGTERGQQQGQQEYQQMMSRTENPGGSSSSSKGDSLQDLEDRIGDMVIT